MTTIFEEKETEKEEEEEEEGEEDEEEGEEDEEEGEEDEEEGEERESFGMRVLETICSMEDGTCPEHGRGQQPSSWDFSDVKTPIDGIKITEHPIPDDLGEGDYDATTGQISEAYLSDYDFISRYSTSSECDCPYECPSDGSCDCHPCYDECIRYDKRHYRKYTEYTIVVAYVYDKRSSIYICS